MRQESSSLFSETHLPEVITEDAELVHSMNALVLHGGVGETGALLVPISSLPSDTLREIFNWCLPTTRDLRDNSAAPVLLTQVCSFWRDLALSTPSLWASFHIKTLSIREPILTERIDQWIHRSGASPLAISIDVLPAVVDLKRRGERLYEMLTKQSNRWKKIVIRAPGSFLDAWTSLSPTDVPILKVFKHHDTTPRPSWSQWTLSDTHALWNSLKLLSADSLREVDLRLMHAPGSEFRINPEHRFGPPQLQLQNLSSLCLGTLCVNLSDVWDFLNQYSQLESGDFSLYGESGPSIREASSLTLPYLSTLRIHLYTHYHHIDFPLFFSKLLLPKLQFFQFSGLMPRVGVWDAASQCLGAPNLSLDLKYLSDPGLVDILQENVYLEQLKITLHPQGGELVHLLLPQHSREVLFPRLRRLELDAIVVPLSSIVIELLKRRSEHAFIGHYFQEAVLHFTGTLPSHILKEFQALQAKFNLRIKISHILQMGQPARCIVFWPDREGVEEEWPLSDLKFM